VDRSLDRAQGGLGIGLSLVQRLVAMHGGIISAHSDGPGRGSEFTVRLPLRPVDEGTNPASLPPPALRPPSSGKRILVVDDNRDAAASLALLLRILGNDIRTAHDGLEAVGVADAFRPDVVLLDIGLPGMNGYDAAQRIRQQPWGAGVIVIATTGWGQEADRDRSREAGFDEHLVKPVDPADLIRLLASLNRSRRFPAGERGA
jgi:CheY-like chemotaxis protein